MGSEFLKMSCPKCASHIEFPRHGIGEQLHCPHCGEAILLSALGAQPHSANNPQQSPLAESSKPLSGCAGCLIALVVAPFALMVIVWLCATVKQAFTPKPQKIPVSAEELGDSWPLTVPNGYIYKREASHGRSEVIFVAPDGTEYGLNGTALSAGYSDIHRITKSRLVFGDPRYEDVSGLIRIGLTGK